MPADQAQAAVDNSRDSAGPFMQLSCWRLPLSRAACAHVQRETFLELYQECVGPCACFVNAVAAF